MKTIAKILAALLVLNGAIQAGRSAMAFYQFEDAARQVAQFGAALSEGEIHERILLLAGEQGIPIEPGDLAVTRDGLRTFVTGAYVDEIPLLPRLYTHPYTWTIDIEVLSVELPEIPGRE